ncbi:MAG: Fe-S cluster assembly protein SufD [Melioribacteraceae bacterium]|nr:Fe-S cluster assembly protein SufD [Melioribacteraceae bacterium]
MNKDKAEKSMINKWAENFRKFEAGLNGESKSEFHKSRQNAFKIFSKLGFPSIKNEEWKYTNLAKFHKHEFVHASEIEEVKYKKEDIEKYLFKGFDHHLLVFVNGKYSEKLSCVGETENNVFIGSLCDLLKEKPELLDNVYKGENNTSAITALNNAFTQDGAAIIVPDNKVIEKPVQVLYLNGTQNEKVHITPYNLIIAGKNSGVKILTSYNSTFENVYFTNAVTNINADENAHVDYYKIQNENENAFHVHQVNIEQQKSSNVSSYSLSFGSQLARNEIIATLNDEDIDCNLFGLYLGKDNQHIDNHTMIDHANPNCRSNELYKGILDDNAHGVFSGKVLVRQDAQKTDAYQSNKTILLSDTASIDTKPQLEIFADDVKCSHGATIGHLDEEAMFYLKTRGIPTELANSMLIRGFVDDVVQTIKIEELKDQINHIIFDHLHKIEI